LAGLLSDQALTPEAAALQQEMARRVEAAVSRLEERDSEIIVMRHYEHLSNQEIAHALNLTEPAASMRYLRAIRRLKEILQAGSSDASAG
jgi:RNA polymerase sigma-70 factor (ECF subfamily)